jgi:hypothetical protein
MGNMNRANSIGNKNSQIKRGNPHKHAENARIDPEKYKAFVGDLQITGI